MPAAKSKRLWNVSGVLKSYTDAKGVYRAVEPWVEGDEKSGAVKASREDIPRLLASGFTDRDPNPKAPAKEED